MDFLKFSEDKSTKIMYCLLTIWSIDLFVQIDKLIAIYRCKIPNVLCNIVYDTNDVQITVIFSIISTLTLLFINKSFPSDERGNYNRAIISIIFCILTLLLCLTIIRSYYKYEILDKEISMKNTFYFMGFLNIFNLIFICLCAYQAIQKYSIIGWVGLLISLGISCYSIYIIKKTIGHFIEK